MTAYEITDASTMTRNEVDDALGGLVAKGLVQVVGRDETGTPDFTCTAKGRRLRSWRRRQLAKAFVRELWAAFCELAVHPQWSWAFVVAISLLTSYGLILLAQHVAGIAP